MYKVVDLFCGAGIGASGFKDLVDIVWAIDNNKHAVHTYNQMIGNHGVCGDIRKIEPQHIPDHDIMIATPVCKSFSVANANGGGFDNTSTGDLSYHFTRLLRDKKPKAFLFENVSGMVGSTHISKFLDMVKCIEQYGYNITWKLVNCADYGVPQDRKRVFLIGIRNDINKEFIFPELSYEDCTIKDSIYDIKDKIGLLANHSETLELGYSPRYLSRNRQRQWNEKAFTIISEVRHLALYPEPFCDIRIADLEKDIIPRRFTVRECLRLQTVPDWFEFDNTVPLKIQYERCSGIPAKVSRLLVQEIINTIGEDTNDR
ncbi:MAG: DNA cytosine methyltransferase [Cetobacterium somerae]